MFAVVDLLNRWGDALTALAAVALWQATLVAIIVALVAWALRRSSPAVRYWLWQLVAIKLLLLPLGSWSVGLAWLPAQHGETARQAAQPSAVQVAEAAIADAQTEIAPPSPALQAGFDSTPIRDAINAAASDAGLPPLLVPPQAQISEKVGSLSLASSEPQSLATSLAQLHWQAWLLLSWALVVALQVTRLIVQRRRLARMLQETTPGSIELTAVVNQIAQQLGMLGSPAVVTTELDCSPFACGVWRPRVVVPTSLLVELNAVQLKQVLAHELAHLKRRDLVWGWLTEVARLLYFFHPAMLFAARRVRLERELACDQIAMQLSGRGPAEYAETLVRVLSSAAVSSAFRTAAASLDGG
jgi:beta-lactamase regulating signal transducer with metallopeptidase domain